MALMQHNPDFLKFCFLTMFQRMEIFVLFMCNCLLFSVKTEQFILIFTQVYSEKYRPVLSNFVENVLFV